MNRTNTEISTKMALRARGPNELRGVSESQIAAALKKYRMPEEAERGVMHWYDETDSVNRKVHSAVFAVEERNGQLWGVAECRVAGELTGAELETLKSYLAADRLLTAGARASSSRRSAWMAASELYVHLWNSDALEHSDRTGAI